MNIYSISKISIEKNYKTISMNFRKYIEYTLSLRTLQQSQLCCFCHISHTIIFLLYVLFSGNVIVLELLKLLVWISKAFANKPNVPLFLTAFDNWYYSISIIIFRILCLTFVQMLFERFTSQQNWWAAFDFVNAGGHLHFSSLMTMTMEKRD